MAWHTATPSSPRENPGFDSSVRYREACSVPADRVRNTAAPILLVAEPAVALWLANLRLDYPTVSPPGHRTTSADHCVRRWATGVCLTLPPARINLDRTERATGCPDTGLAKQWAVTGVRDQPVRAATSALLCPAVHLNIFIGIQAPAHLELATPPASTNYRPAA